jgi:hypothetical protein
MTITYSFETSTMTNLNGKKQKETKSIVDGDLGVSVYFLRKTDNDFKKVKAVEKDGKFSVVTKIGEDENTQEMDEKEFLKFAKADEDLEFAVSYMKKRLRGGLKRVAKAKKTTKKASKKASKRGSKVVRRVRKV